MEVRQYSASDRQQWNDFLLNSKNATFLFNRSYIEYHSDRFRDHSLLFFDSGELIAVMPGNIDRNNVFHSHEGLTYGGIVFRENEKMNNILKVFQAGLKYLHQQNIEALVYKPLPRFYRTVPGEDEDYPLFILNAQLFRRDLALAIDTRFRSTPQKRRIRAQQKAIKKSVRIAETHSLQDFWDKILTPNLLKRHGVNPVHSLQEITHLKSQFPQFIRQFNAYLDDEIVAGVTIYESSGVAHAQYIAANDKARDSGAIDLLFFHLIETVFTDKTFFDFGTCNEAEGRQLNHGLLDWKEGFGARAYSHDFYHIQPENHHLLEKVIK